MMKPFQVIEAEPSMFTEIGALLVEVYSQLENFPTPEEQPGYYQMLANIGELTKQPATHLLAALGTEGEIAGAVVYFSDMAYYGSGGTATQEKNAAGFRLLGVAPNYRNKGIGRLLAQACVDRAREENQQQLIIHTTQAMQLAWEMYLRMGFVRSADLDFMQEKLPVFGFRMQL